MVAYIFDKNVAESAKQQTCGIISAIGTHGVILAPSLPRPIDCRPPRTPHSRLATRLRVNPMTTCPMSWGRSDQESASSPRRAWRMTSAVIATRPVRRPPEGSRASKEASSGLGRSERSHDLAITIWSSYMPGVKAFLLPQPCRRSGPGARSPVSRRESTPTEPIPRFGWQNSLGRQTTLPAIACAHAKYLER
jgi:hypothetical protein